MSPDSLPDDCSQWPRDPFQLLGLDRQADAAALRSAYVQLIRRFKPDHHPEEFRRIREAYELARVLISRDISFEDAEPESSVPDAREAPAVRVDDNSRRRRDEPVEDSSQAYAQLCDQLQSRSPNTYLRLYWRLKLEPQLDPECHAVDWLVASFLAGQVDARLLQLYRWELDQEPALVGRVDPDRLYPALSHGDIQAGLLEIRMQALFQTDQWDAASEEQKQARAAMWSERGEWLRSLLSLGNRLAWLMAPGAISMRKLCAAEIDDASDLHLAVADELDAHEWLREFSGDWRAAQHHAASFEECRKLLELVPDTWALPVEEWRTRLLVAVEPWLDAPGQMLPVLDRFGEVHSRVLSYLYKVLSKAARDAGRRAPDFPARWVKGFPFIEERPAYEAGRLEILRVCLRDGIQAEVVSRYVSQDYVLKSAADRPSLVRLANDLSLHCLVRACLLFST